MLKKPSHGFYLSPRQEDPRSEGGGGCIVVGGSLIIFTVLGGLAMYVHRYAERKLEETRYSNNERPFSCGIVCSN